MIIPTIKFTISEVLKINLYIILNKIAMVENSQIKQIVWITFLLYTYKNQMKLWAHKQGIQI